MSAVCEPKPRGLEADRPATILLCRGNSQGGWDRRLSPKMTWPDFLERYAIPLVLQPSGDSERTFAEYRQTAKYWRNFTGDPSLDETNEWHCAQFVAELGRLHGRRRAEHLSPNTVRKHCTHQQHAFDLAGPRGRDNRLGADLLANSPFLQRPAAWVKEVEDNFELGELEQWLAACDTATLPRIGSLRPAAWWRALIVVLYNLGIRIGTALAMTFDMFRRDDKGRMWLNVPPGIIKKHRGEKFYVNAPAWEAVQEIRLPDRRLVFPWPNHRRTLDDVRVRLLGAAQIPAGRKFGFHGIRKAMCTEVAEQNPLVAQKQAGHLGMAMTRDHYVNRSVVAQTMEQVRQPAKRKPAKIDPRQRFLFE